MPHMPVGNVECLGEILMVDAELGEPSDHGIPRAEVILVMDADWHGIAPVQDFPVPVLEAEAEPLISVARGDMTFIGCTAILRWRSRKSNFEHKIQNVSIDESKKFFAGWKKSPYGLSIKFAVFRPSGRDPPPWTSWR